MKSKIFALLLSASACFAQGHRSFSVDVQGSGPAMILIPGLQCPREVWREFIVHYSSRYQIHAVTIAGFAGEPAIPGLGLAKVKDDLIEYIRENKLTKPVIVGHSLGGFLALWIASSAPDLAGRIISVDGLPFLPGLFAGGVDAEKLRTLYASMKADQLENMSRMALGQMISNPKQVELAAQWAGRSDPSFVGQAMYDLMTIDLRPELRKLRVPVLLIGAGKAFSSDSEQFAKVRTAYEDQVKTASDHSVVMAERALHFVMLDDPEFLERTADKFLERR